MVGRVKAYFHNLRLLGDESLSCPACERQIPADGDYCLWCGVDLAHAFRYREDLETEVTVPDADVSEVVIMALAAGRRKRPHPDSARALYAFEAMHVDRPEQPVLECLSRLDLTPLDYQAETAANVIGRLRGRAILADEVGLGKTIEAGLVLKELLVRGLARQVLICVPSSLVEQWRGELIDKFDIVPATHEDRFYWRKRIVLLSLSRAKLPHVARRLLRRS